MQTADPGYLGRLYNINDANAVTGTTSSYLYGIEVIMANSASLTWSATSSDPTMFTASVSGNNLVITPQPDQFGSGTAHLTLTNANGGSVTQDIPVTINAVNDAPILAALDPITCVEDVTYVLDIASKISDVDNTVAEMTVLTSSHFAVVNGTVISFTYPEGVSHENVTVTVRDPGGLTASQILAVTVTQINDKPYFTTFPTTVTCDATVPKVLPLDPSDEETNDAHLEIYTNSDYINVTGQTLHLLYPKGIGTEVVTVYLVDELTYGVQNNVSYTMSVTIIDHPEVTDHAPTGDSVPIVSPVRVTFDMPMNITTVENAFSLKLGSADINGTFSWSNNGTAMTFTPESYMLAGNYTVNMAATAETPDGVRMLGAHNWEFTVVYGDYDGDGMPDEWEIQHGLDPTANDAAGDLDGDGMPNLYEFEEGLDPSDPSDAHLDSDGDGYTNLEEYEAGTDPNDPSSAPSEFNWIILLIIIVSVVAVLALVLVLKGRKKPAEPEEWQQGDQPPPPPEGQPPYQEGQYPPPEQPPMEPTEPPRPPDQ